MEIEKLAGRQLDLLELARVKTVGDLIDLVGSTVSENEL
jgi:acyl carrier protein